MQVGATSLCLFWIFIEYFILFLADQPRTSSQPDPTAAAPQQRKRKSDDSEAGPSSRLDPPAAKPKRNKTKPNQPADDLPMPDQELITDNAPRPPPNNSPMPDPERTTTNALRPRPKDT